jgi:hypothetical protein
MTPSKQAIAAGRALMRVWSFRAIDHDEAGFDGGEWSCGWHAEAREDDFLAVNKRVARRFGLEWREVNRAFNYLLHEPQMRQQDAYLQRDRRCA